MNNQNNSITDRYEILTGFRKETTIEGKLQVGAAFKEQDEAYYKIRLMMFPGMTYYLVKNQNQLGHYTIYAKMFFDNNKQNKVKFTNPVGSGHLDTKLQSYLELRFPLLRAYMYMSLYPDTLNNKKAA